MVNFTCNTCGDSLKKKEVNTHFARKSNCRLAPSLTCFDCLKVFGNDYVHHTTCVTEDQRYSANGLKGVEKTKTQIWTESVHKHFYSILIEKEASLSTVVKNLIQFLLNVGTVPKKEKAFFNLLNNTRKFQEKDIRTVWNMVNELTKQLENQPNVNDKPQKKNTPNKNDANAKTNRGEKSLKESAAAEKVAEEEAKNEGKKKKKSKKTAELNEEMEDAIIGKDIPEAKEEKRISESVDTLQTNGNSKETQMEVEEQSEEVQSEKLSKKQKKLKKKREKFEAELKSVEAEKAHEDQLDDIEDPVDEDKEAKKKKKKKHNVESEVAVEMDKQKKKKRERTVSMAAETDQPLKKNKSKGNDENAEPNEDVAEDVPSYRKEFNWADVIIQVLQSQDGNEMSVKRLCKKVVNEYLSSLLDGAHLDELRATARFQKKLHKTPGVFVHKDRAKLKSVE